MHYQLVHIGFTQYLHVLRFVMGSEVCDTDSYLFFSIAGQLPSMRSRSAVREH